MAELKDRQQQEAQGMLQCPSCLMLMARVLVLAGFDSAAEPVSAGRRNDAVRHEHVFRRDRAGEWNAEPVRQSGVYEHPGVAAWGICGGAVDERRAGGGRGCLRGCAANVREHGVVRRRTGGTGAVPWGRGALIYRD